jgi:serine protease Do
MAKATTTKRTQLLFICAVLVVVVVMISFGFFGLSWQSLASKISLPLWKPSTSMLAGPDYVRVTSEESVIIDAVEKVSPSVVTIGIKQTRRVGDLFEFNPFDPFSPFRRRPGRSQEIEQDIGSGFIVGTDGLVVTNKHVVSEPDATYRVITKDDKTYDVVRIYRDPSNDMAILKIDATGLPVVEMGDSDKLKVGQLAIAIGTALGEFRNTVTTGVISGVGRGITAGGFFDQEEKLENVIQTDAAINPGNSGGPLLNSSGQVIGVNVAVSAQGQNIGFALPINTVKEAMNTFNQTGQFDRPFLGVQFRMITRQIAILNELPEGAYVMEVVSGGPADKAGVEAEDIITKIDNEKLTDANDLSRVIGKKKVGDRVTLSLWRDGEDVTVTVVLGNQAEQ